MLSLLIFRGRAKRIQNHAVVNEDPNTKIIRELQEQVRRKSGRGRLYNAEKIAGSGVARPTEAGATETGEISLPMCYRCLLMLHAW
jgi:hypothetical protein